MNSRCILSFILVLAAVVALQSAAAQAQMTMPTDAAAIERCLKEEWAKDAYGDRCYGVVADPCRALPDGKSIAGATACFTREYRAWNEILDRIYRRLKVTLSRNLLASLDKSQRTWVQSRKLSCEFFWDFVGRAHARPTVENCFGRETANRALHLQVFLNSKR